MIIRRVKLQIPVVYLPGWPAAASSEAAAGVARWPVERTGSLTAVPAAAAAALTVALAAGAAVEETAVAFPGEVAEVPQREEHSVA